jgi:ribonuclease P protein component
MLGRTYRFHGYNSLRGVYRRGRTVRGPLMSLRFAEGGREKPYRAAVVVSRKVSKSAVVRNRIRRRVYGVLQEEALVRPGTDLIFTVFSDRLADMPADELEKTVRELLEKAAQAGPS